jgi:hypothetical protein
MPAIQRISDRHALVDLVALDRDDRPVLMVAAEEQKPYPELLDAYLEVLQAIRRDIPFVILANIEEMTIYRKDRTRSLQPIATIPTKETLRFYSPDFGETRVFKDYLVGMIDAWLRDFMMHWKSPTPPASEAMTALGLAGLLDGGRTKRRVRLACLPVRGDEFPDELRNGAEPWSAPHPPESARIPPTDHA